MLSLIVTVAPSGTTVEDLTPPSFVVSFQPVIASALREVVSYSRVISCAPE